MPDALTLQVLVTQSLLFFIFIFRFNVAQTLSLVKNDKLTVRERPEQLEANIDEGEAFREEFR